MAKVSRLDLGEFRSPHRTPQGYLRADAYATRIGILLYRNHDGSERREFRPAEEVFRKDSLTSLAGVPVTDDHPPFLLTAANTREYARGYTGESVNSDGEFVRTSVTIFDSDLIAKAEAGHSRELSCGYECELDWTPGEYNGERYDCVQRNIVYNHVAALARGRAGKHVELKLDSAGNSYFGSATTHSDGETHMEMVSLTVDNIAYQIPTSSAAAIAAKLRQDSATIGEQQTVVTDLEAKLAAARAELERMKGQTDELKQTVDQQKAELEKAKDGASAEKMDGLVKERVKLLSLASKVVDVSKVNLDSMSNMEIKKAVVIAKSPSSKERMDSASEPYIDGRFESICELIAQSHTDGLGKSVSERKNDGASGDEVGDARRRWREDSRKAWQPKAN